MENSDKNSVRPQNKNLRPPMKKGETLNPNGRPKGKKNFATIYREALEHLAKLNNTTADALETEMYANALKKARAGDFAFYRDTLDRLHGKPVQTITGDETNPIHIVISQETAERYAITPNPENSSS